MDEWIGDLKRGYYSLRASISRWLVEEPTARWKGRSNGLHPPRSDSSTSGPRTKEVYYQRTRLRTQSRPTDSRREVCSPRLGCRCVWYTLQEACRTKAVAPRVPTAHLRSNRQKVPYNLTVLSSSQSRRIVAYIALPKITPRF